MKNTIPASLAAAISLIQGEHSPDGLAVIYSIGHIHYIAAMDEIDELAALMADNDADPVHTWHGRRDWGNAYYSSREAAQSANLDRMLEAQETDRLSQEDMTDIISSLTPSDEDDNGRTFQALCDASAMFRGLTADQFRDHCKAWLDARRNEPNTPVVAVIHAPEWAFPPSQQERLLDGLEASGYWSAYSDDLAAIEETLTADMGGFYGWRVDLRLEMIGKCAKSDRYTGTLTASIVG